MELTNLQPWDHDSADQSREELKRWRSPSSFFYSQGHALVLAAGYFRNARLVPSARGGVAKKHRHRIHLALFGQLLASLEYLFKDFVAQVIDIIDIYDSKVRVAKWIDIDTGRVLHSRTIRTTPGAMLLHSTLGWHDPRVVNQRYSDIFQAAPISNLELDTLERLWILRHSVAHNAGFVIAQDAARGGMPELSDSVVNIDEDFIRETFEFLCLIAKRISSTIGDKVIMDWLRTKAHVGKDYKRDKQIYIWLKWLAAYVDSRASELPTPRKGEYSTDYKRANS